jgi:hypothetical protein
MQPLAPTVIKMKPAQPARRGDLVVVQQHHRDWVQRGEPREYDTFTVGVVTSITRDGLVKMFKEAGHADEPDWRGRPDRGRPLPAVGFVQALVRSAAVIDVPGALATAACRTWELTGSVRPYDTLDEVRAALGPHSKTQPTWEPLHEAAETHAALARGAWEAYRRDTYAMPWDSPRYRAYTAQVAAANRGYLLAYTQITAAAGLAAQPRSPGRCRTAAGSGQPGTPDAHAAASPAGHQSRPGRARQAGRGKGSQLEAGT